MNEAFEYYSDSFKWTWIYWTRFRELKIQTVCLLWELRTKKGLNLVRRNNCLTSLSFLSALRVILTSGICKEKVSRVVMSQWEKTSAINMNSSVEWTLKYVNLARSECVVRWSCSGTLQIKFWIEAIRIFFSGHFK